MKSTLDRHFRVQSIVFDLFHTLVDPEDFRPRGFNRAYRIADLLGFENKDRFAEWWKGTERERHVSKSKKVVEFVDDYANANLGRRCTIEEKAQINLICGQFQDTAILNPRPGTLAALSALRARGTKLGLLSNADESEVANWDRSPISTFFQSVCFSFKIGYSKPSKEAYASILHELGARAASSVYVGDGGHNELEGAKEAGFGLVVFMGGFVSKNGMRGSEQLRRLAGSADLAIEGLDKLPGILDSLEERLDP
jgi:HAD superfamily hydrolase (TIGR01549 family)